MRGYDYDDPALHLPFAVSWPQTKGSGLGILAPQIFGCDVDVDPLRPIIPACRDVEDPEIFFESMTNRSSNVAAAKRICADCSLQKKCLDWALSLESQMGERYVYGIYGGATSDERRRILLRRRSSSFVKEKTV